ncbi:hypothetical protein ACFQ4C_15330 [Larkinella insperata]|uniref:DUF2029 domain-containing protein n=1 Tax=Larkinella insperata TaxID=332158 RepID=A0ABW3Q8X7_9BACT|nr:hypothetical protein [Larkinella insperata]
MSVVLFKIAIAFFGSLVTLALVRFRHLLSQLSFRQQGPVMLMFFILLRVVPFLIVYVGLKQESGSDVPVFYDAAVHALRGEVVYRDFWTPYSPLFPYITAIFLPFWNSPNAIIFLMILVEGATLWLTWRVYQAEYRDIFPRMLIYLTLVGPMVLCVLGGQEDIWMWFFGALSALVWQRTQDSLWIGVVMAVALMVTKALPVLLLLPLFFLVQKPLRYVLGLAVTGLPALGGLVALVGTKFTAPMSIAELPFAPNLWTVLSPLIGDFRPYSRALLWVGVALTVLVTSLGAIILKQRMNYAKALPILWTLCFCFMMFIHKNSFSNYAFIFLMPMLINVMDFRNRRLLALLILFNALVVIQPSYWWRIHNPLFIRWRDLLSRENLIEYGMELAILGCLMYFMVHLYRIIAHGHYQAINSPVEYPSTR